MYRPCFGALTPRPLFPVAPWVPVPRHSLFRPHLQAGLADVVTRENSADLSWPSNAAAGGGRSSPRDFEKRGLYFQEMVRLIAVAALACLYFQERKR